MEKIFKDLITGLDSSRHDRSVKFWKGNGSPEIAFRPSGSNVRDKGFSTAWLHVEKNRIGTDWIDWNKSFRPKTWINRMKGIKKKRKELFSLYPSFWLGFRTKIRPLLLVDEYPSCKKEDEPGEEKKSGKWGEKERTRKGKMEKSNVPPKGWKIGERWSSGHDFLKRRFPRYFCAYTRFDLVVSIMS